MAATVATAATSGGWVYVINPDGRFVYPSDASREFIGYEPSDLLGREARSLLSPIDTRVGDVRQHVNVVVVRGRHRDGTDHWFEVTIAPVLGIEGSDILGYGGTARLFTDERHPAILREIHRREAAVLGNPSLADAPQAGGIDPGRIVIEVTEHASVSDYSKLTRPRHRLRGLGCGWLSTTRAPATRLCGT